MATSTYLIALGSNVRGRHGAPRETLRTAAAALGATLSSIHDSAPMGPSRRRYANAIAVVASDLAPPDQLDRIKQIERAFGRRPGRRWGDRPLDLDIIGWSEGIWASRGLAIPHPAFRERCFVLGPLVEVASHWRDPVTNLSARHLLARLDRKRPRP